MSKVQQLALAVIMTTLMTYLSIAFIHIEMNAFLWPYESRMAFCYISLVLSWVTGGVPYILFKDK